MIWFELLIHNWINIAKLALNHDIFVISINIVILLLNNSINIAKLALNQVFIVY